ncbi:efflux RND transporter periplasmic adaptor subunit [Sulfitobacter faviae]|uniref:Efflux RND transporter periplasmic adaptor subunit n=1 Tax=Sulfitobacter faviae TaxID=1775881 RepID=A0ABZ0V1H1_9RHOB|nr:efflux RND transporter periplasmic adaptor subunit [Sulfitobacter faviae]WPZ22473.1 efflux RND transporter periplasmic adaptor subunit [Sulfitobacter faviae]
MAKWLVETTRGTGAGRVLGFALALAAGVAAPMVAAAEMPVVKLQTVKVSDAEVERVFFGKVVARETVDLAFQVGGQIKEFPVEEGATVSEDTVVARMDLEPFQLALEQAQANDAQARRTMERYQKLAGSSVAEVNLQDAETAVTVNDIAVRNAERDLENATLHAPFDAIVASRLVPNYSTVSAGTPVVRLHDMSELRVEIDVPETLFLRAGRDPSVRFMAKFPANANTYPMQIREYNAETADVGQTYSITLGAELPEDFVPLPGASVEVRATLNIGGSSIIVPDTAIVVGNDRGTYVMVFDPTGAREGTVTRTAVEITPTARGDVKVEAGLSDGQEIVVSGASQLEDGAAVRRFVGFGD